MFPKLYAIAAIHVDRRYPVHPTSAKYAARNADYKKGNFALWPSDISRGWKIGPFAAHTTSVVMASEF